MSAQAKGWQAEGEGRTRALKEEELQKQSASGEMAVPPKATAVQGFLQTLHFSSGQFKVLIRTRSEQSAFLNPYSTCT